MKRTISFVLVLSILTTHVFAGAYNAPDIVINTKLNSDWSGVLVAKIRRLLKNFGEADPFKQKFDRPMTVSDSLIQDYLNPSAKELVSDLGQVIGMDVLNGKTQVTIHGLEYDVRGFRTELKTAEDESDGVLIASDFSASKIKVSAEKLTLSLLLPGKNSLPLINIDIIKPVISADEHGLVKFFAQLKIKDQKVSDQFKLELENVNFENLATSLVDQGHAILLDFEKIVVPEVTVRLGNKNLTFDPKRIESLLRSKRDGLKGLLVGQFSSLLKKGMGEDMLKTLNKVSFAKEYWIDSTAIQSGLRLEAINGDIHGNDLTVNFSGDFCTNEKFQTYHRHCTKNKISQIPASRITKDHHLRSLEDMKMVVESGEANIVASISEDYVNKLLLATYDAGLWKEMLEKAGAKMGPNKVFFRLDEKGSDKGTLYLDLLYTPKKIERLAIGAKEVRFPLVLKAGLKIRHEDNIPVFVVHISEIDTSDDMLLNGRSEIGVLSNVNQLRFKKKILETIRSETASLANQDVLELKYNELKNLGLETVDFVSDGNGRMNAMMSLKASRLK
jgi:hypothetical protein